MTARTPTPETPAALGYRMPGEWDRHAATWLSWPHRHKTWPGKFEPIPAVWVEFIRVLAQGEIVHVMAGGDEVWAEASRMVGQIPGVLLHNFQTNDAWCRDHGPTFLVGKPGLPPALVDWRFNAWGEKSAFEKDDAVPRQVAQLTQRRRFEPGIVLEGGSIDPNGRGTILTTEACLLNKNRNPHLTREEIETYLADYLGCPHVLWLGDGIVGDDTDGHVDDLTRFVNPTTVVTAVEEDPADVNYAALAENLKRLAKMKDQDGRPLEVVPLPMPRPVEHAGQRLPASYANFYIANHAVVVPTFNDPADAVAIATLQKLFPTRRVQGLHAVDLVWGRGTFHCISQQEPSLG